MSLAHASDQLPSPSVTYRRRQPDGMADLALRTFLSINSGVALETWTRANVAVIDLLRVPQSRRRQGLGTRVYQLWEATLRQGMRVELFAVDAEAVAFWTTLGFQQRGDIMFKIIEHQHSLDTSLVVVKA